MSRDGKESPVNAGRSTESETSICESLVFVGVHIKYREVAPMMLSGVLGLLMAFLAYGRMVLEPIF